LILIAAIFGLIAASRIVRLDYRELHPDEVWSVWQTFGTVDQIIRWTPYDWTPAFYLAVGAWRALTGANPITLIVLSLFVYLIGVACLYRLARRLFGETAGIMAMLAYSALGYNVFISIFLRAYVFVLTLVVVALWMAVRYFERPTRKRAILLVVALAAPIYLHITGLFAVAMIGIFTLIVYLRRVKYWLLPGAITIGLLVPVALWLWNTLGTAASKLGERSNLFQYRAFLEALFQDLLKIWRDLVGYEQATWIAFMIVAGVIIVTGWCTWRQRLQTVGLAVWILSPVVLIVVAQLFFAFNIRHLAWVSIGIALWLAWAFSTLPGRANVGIAVILAIGMFGPMNINEPDRDHVTTVFKQMAHAARAGDVIVVDPENKILNAEEWDYYMRIYFPEGITFIAQPESQRRVWYAFSKEKHDAGLEQAIQQRRTPRNTLSSQRNFVMQLYEGPPNVEGVPFANGMRFHGIEFVEQRGPTLARRPGESFRVRLWWSIDQVQVLDYSVGIQVIGAMGMITQVDSAPQTLDGPSETSRWIMGRYYTEEREITLPYSSFERVPALYLTVYHWTDQKRLTAPGVNSDSLLPLGTINVQHWLGPRATP
jgi:hypothetical protein